MHMQNLHFWIFCTGRYVQIIPKIQIEGHMWLAPIHREHIWAKVRNIYPRKYTHLFYDPNSFIHTIPPNYQRIFIKWNIRKFILPSRRGYRCPAHVSISAMTQPSTNGPETITTTVPRYVFLLQTNNLLLFFPWHFGYCDCVAIQLQRIRL